MANNETQAWYQSIFQKRMLVVLLIGFASGLPLGLTGTTLQAWFTMENVDIVTIGFLALIGQPYVYKFLWAPAVDKLSPGFLGRRRGWMLCTQVILIALLLCMSFFSPAFSPVTLGIVALSVAIMSATQDIVIDAYRTEVLAPKERGTGAATFVMGYRIALIVSTGLTLILANFIGFKNVYILMAGLMGIGVFATLWGKEPKHYSEPPPSFMAACIGPFKEFLTRDNAILLLLLIVLYKLGDAFANTLTTTFLLRGLGFSLDVVGVVNKIMGLTATILGAFVGGYFLSKMGLYRALLWFGFLQAVTNFLFMVLAWMGPNFYMMVCAITIENLAGGMGTAAFLAFLMSLCHSKYTATQYALLSALSAIGRVFVGPMAGYLVEWLGWAEFFFWTVIFAIPGLVLLVYLKSTIDENEKKVDAPLAEDMV